MTEVVHLQTKKKIIEASDNFNVVRVFFPGSNDDSEDEPCIAIQTMVRCGRASHAMARLARFLASVMGFLQKKDKFSMRLTRCKQHCIGAEAFDIFISAKNRGRRTEDDDDHDELITPENIREALDTKLAFSENPDACIIPNIIVNLKNTNAEEILDEFVKGSMFRNVLQFVFKDGTSFNMKTSYVDSTFDVQKYKL